MLLWNVSSSEPALPPFSGMDIKRRPLEPKAHGLPMNHRDYFKGHGRVCYEHPVKEGPVHFLATEDQGGVEEFPILPKTLHMGCERFTWLPEAPVVMHIHIHERRDVEFFVQFVTTKGRVGPVLRFIQNVAVCFPPGSIVDFDNDGFQAASVPVIAVIKGCRIEAMAKVSEVTKESYRTGKAFPCS